MTHPSFHRAALAGLTLGAALALAPLAQAAPEISSDVRQDYPQATLSAQASADVMQDTVEITLAAEIADASQTQVSDQLNARLSAVMKQAKGHDGIEARSGNYRIWPTTDRDGRISEWRGHAEIVLRSRDFEAASALAAQLSDDMPIAGLDFSVSRESRLAEEQKLTTQAVKAFQDRAQALTEALGFPAYRLRTMDVGGSGEMPPVPAPRMMTAMMSAGKAAAPVEGGHQTLTVSVQGTIVLQPTQTATAR